uniref:Uncharacterized protein n=1 Tax=Rhizophora mucronata TaxID=61149 RepID=A0A2P2ITU6_RHIMU
MFNSAIFLTLVGFLSIFQPDNAILGSCIISKLLHLRSFL